MTKPESPTATHKVSFYGIRCYMNDTTGEMWGVNWLCDKLLTAAYAFHHTMGFFFPETAAKGFPLYILEEYKDEK